MSLFLGLATSFSLCYAGDIKYLQDFRGTTPGSTSVGDLFGNSLSINDKYVFIGAPGASPQGNQAAGGLYFFRKSCVGCWEISQPTFTTSIPYAFTSYNQVLSRKDWLFVSQTGSPSLVGNPTDSSGSILVFKKNGFVWDLVQTILNPQGPMDGSEEYFGSHLDSDGKQWLVVGGDYIDTLYFYKLNEESGVWELFQQESPPGMNGNKAIFANISDHHVLASALPSDFPGDENGAVYAYQWEEDHWEYLQTLEGNSPISTVYNTGDMFGKALAVYHNWAVIGAPTDNELSDLGGAVYFYHFSQKRKAWEKTQKYFSEMPTVFFGWNAAIEKNIAIVGDPGRTILTEEGRHLFQGAAVIFRRHPITWKQGERTWSPIETVIDSLGRAYDFFGAGGIDIHNGLIGIGSNPLADAYLPDSYPNKKAFPFTAPPNRGHVILYRNDH